MLNIVLLSLLGAFICFIVSNSYVLLRASKGERKEKLKENLLYTTIIFFVDIVLIAVLFYVCSFTQTIVSLIINMWSILLFNVLINFFRRVFTDIDIDIGTDMDININYNFHTNCILCVISLILLLSGKIITPAQNFIYTYNEDDIEVAYIVSSGELMAKTSLNLERYSLVILKPEIRKVKEEFVAIYKIERRESFRGKVEYIPGYGIQYSGESIQFVTKRSYFDTSLYNSRDTKRMIRRNYPTVILLDSKFDIDDELNPFQIYLYRENLYYAKEGSYGVITIDLQNGSIQKYSNDEIPIWVDFISSIPK